MKDLPFRKSVFYVLHLEYSLDVGLVSLHRSLGKYVALLDLR